MYRFAMRGVEYCKVSPQASSPASSDPRFELELELELALELELLPVRRDNPA